MRRFFALAYAVASYAVFFGTILYAIGFVSGTAVPKVIDDGPTGSIALSILIDVALMSLFAVQHSVMARQRFKAWWTRFVPRHIERSTYVLFSSLALIVLFWLWRPLPAVLWNVQETWLANALVALSMLGWLVVFASTFLINHFELFGLHQVVAAVRNRDMPRPRFRTPLFYRFVRHPIYLGFIVAFWATPHMTVGHLLFAAVTTAYIFVGIALEERDLIDMFGEEYRRYRKRVPMLFPRMGAAAEDATTPQPRQPRSATTGE